MAEILFIAPLRELASLVKEVSHQEGAPEIDIKVARMKDGVRLALEAGGRGYHVLVSHIPIKVDEKVEGVVTTFQSVDRL